TGELLRDLVDFALRKKFGIVDINFKDLHSRTQVHLRLPGTCLSTNETVWFDHTGIWGGMSVADAVRISSGFPFAFKPVCFLPTSYRPSGNSIKIEETFMFVDGGLINNLPLHAFDKDADNGVSQAEEHIWGARARKPTSAGSFNET